MNRPFRCAFALSAFTVVVGMQTAAADDAGPDAAPAPVNCPKPEGAMPLKGTKAEMTRYQQRIDDYKGCVNAYSSSNMTKAKELQAQARNLQTQAQSTQAQAVAYQARAEAYATAANGAIDDFNTYVNDLKVQDAKTR